MILSIDLTLIGPTILGQSGPAINRNVYQVYQFSSDIWLDSGGFIFDST